MEIELLRRQAFQIGVHHKSVGIRAQIVLAEVRKRSIHEAVRDSLSIHVLLPHTAANLLQIQRSALRSRHSHRLQRVIAL